jgi:hypothetical protein
MTISVDMVKSSSGYSIYRIILLMILAGKIHFEMTN